MYLKPWQMYPWSLTNQLQDAKLISNTIKFSRWLLRKTSSFNLISGEPLQGGSPRHQVLSKYSEFLAMKLAKRHQVLSKVTKILKFH